MLGRYGMFGLAAVLLVAVGSFVWDINNKDGVEVVEPKLVSSEKIIDQSVVHPSSKALYALHAISPNDQRAVMSLSDGKMTVIEPTSTVKLNGDDFSVIRFSTDKLVLKSQSNNDLYLFHKAVNGVSFLQHLSSTPPMNDFEKIVPVKSKTLAN